MPRQASRPCSGGAFVPQKLAGCTSTQQTGGTQDRAPAPKQLCSFAIRLPVCAYLQRLLQCCRPRLKAWLAGMQPWLL